ncbi:MAG: hypothetical protein R3318_06240, partial [Gammaproteobacteria bacterium]|nr:hypothetical protein [Gammaproteobacteria bacterium]
MNTYNNNVSGGLLFPACFALAGLITPASLAAQDAVEQETIEVIGITPTHGIGLPEDVIPYNVQSASSEDFDRSQS